MTLKAADDADSLGLIFESPKEDRVGEYEMKLMDIDQEHLGIPDTEYAATISMPSVEFRRIVADLTAMSESGRFLPLLLLSSSLLVLFFPSVKGSANANIRVSTL